MQLSVHLIAHKDNSVLPEQETLSEAEREGTHLNGSNDNNT